MLNLEAAKDGLVFSANAKDINKFKEIYDSFAAEAAEPVHIYFIVQILCAGNVSGFLVDEPDKEKVADIAGKLRMLIYKIFISTKTLYDYKFAYLYKIFAAAPLEKSEKFSRELEFTEAHYLTLREDSERLKFAYYIFSVDFMNGGGEEALSRFVTKLCPIRYFQIEWAMVESFRKLANLCSVPLDPILDGVSVWMEEENYFSLDIYQRKSIFNWCFNIFWNTDIGYNNLKWMSLYEKWRNLLYKHMEKEQTAEVMWLHFFIYHFMGNSYQTQEQWKIHNDEIDRPASEYYAKCGQAMNLPLCGKKEGGKIKIAIVKDRIVRNSPFKVEYSCLKALMKNEKFTSKYEIAIFTMNYIEKSDDTLENINMFKDLGVPVYNPVLEFKKNGMFNSHLDKALKLREAIIAYGADMMIVPVNGYDISSFLFANRTAPVQVYWSHGNYVYDVEGIDARISHSSYTNSEYGFRTFTAPMDLEEFYDPPVDRQKVAAVRAKFPADAVLLGTVGRLVKADCDEFIDTVAEIMKKHPDAVYVCCGSGDRDSLLKKAKKHGISERFYMPGLVDPHIFGNIMDIWLDTFPLMQGVSRQEAAAKGVPVVNIYDMPNLTPLSHMFIDKKNAMLESRGYKPLHPMSDAESYIEYASILIADEELRKEISVLEKERIVYQFGTVEDQFIKDIMKILEEL